jgi:23S rRNA (cytidine1920-2'-O)/16S rRNA (cytidine1409-2'-O)-methyltransferase
MNRLDKELVIRGLVSSRSKASELIDNKKVLVDGKIITKQSFMCDETNDIKILENDILKYVSRAGLKLDHAVKSFNINFNDKVVMDVGSSTGGFTQVALENGASKVVAIDVGTDVMVEPLRSDNRVELHEQLNIKDAPNSLFKDVNYIVSDVSFISIKRVIDKVCEQDKKYNMILLIKPQFECGKDIADKYKGVILDKDIHISILKDIFKYLQDRDYYVNNLDVSPIKGGDGNIEYLINVSNMNELNNINIKTIVDRAFSI